jgi:hypothetical protein
MGYPGSIVSMMAVQLPVILALSAGLILMSELLSSRIL